MAAYGIITAPELKAQLDAGETIRLIDVREPHEHHYAKIPGAELKPLGQIMVWAQQLTDKDETIVLHCHHGMRSQRACMLLAGNGFTHVTNLTGGIDQWSLTVDPEVRRY